MANKRIFKILGIGGAEIARAHVPQGDGPVQLEVLDQNAWEILELDVQEVVIGEERDQLTKKGEETLNEDKPVTEVLPESEEITPDDLPFEVRNSEPEAVVEPSPEPPKARAKKRKGT